MNTVHLKNNSYKNGDLFDRSKKIAKDKAKSVEPSISQLKYRDELYKFLVEKGIVGDGFRLGRTKQAIRSSISALLTLLKKHGLDEEFFEKEKEDDNG
jgi:hypothetical protein